MEKTQTMKMHLREKDVMGTNDDERYGVLMTPHLHVLTHIVVPSSYRRRATQSKVQGRKGGKEGRKEGGTYVRCSCRRNVASVVLREWRKGKGGGR